MSLDHSPQAAIIGFAVTEQFELVFDTLASTRKAANLRVNPHIALVIGGWNDNDSRTVQYEDVADFPVGAELERLKQAYFTVFPDGPTRLSWPGITYVWVKPLQRLHGRATGPCRTPLRGAMSPHVRTGAQPFHRSNL